MCSEPSAQLLDKCKHPSIGVCGEKFPEKCRICDKEEVETIFFGYENEKDARFIQLEDCHHYYEVEGLIRMMKNVPESENHENSDNDESISSNAIQFKTCPLCKVQIRHTKSLNTYIQASVQDIQQVKVKLYGSQAENEHSQNILYRKVQKILESEAFGNDPLDVKAVYLDVCRNLSKPQSKQALVQLNNKFKLVDKLWAIVKIFESRTSPQTSVSDEIIDNFEKRLRIADAFVRQFKNCEQQRADLSAELTFIEMMAEAIAISTGKTFKDNGSKLLGNAFKVADKFGPGDRVEFSTLVEEAWKHSGLAISLEEKEMVLKAMGFERGHWYKCSKGHIYAIGDCGGAMETSQCPECGELIGGSSHRLISGNAVATEMDGATAPAWPQ